MRTTAFGLDTEEVVRGSVVAEDGSLYEWLRVTEFVGVRARSVLVLRIEPPRERGGSANETRTNIDGVEVERGADGTTRYRFVGYRPSGGADFALTRKAA